MSKSLLLLSLTPSALFCLSFLLLGSLSPPAAVLGQDCEDTTIDELDVDCSGQGEGEIEREGKCYMMDECLKMHNNNTFFPKKKKFFFFVVQVCQP